MYHVNDPDRISALLDEALNASRRALADLQAAKAAIFGIPENDNPATAPDQQPQPQQRAQITTRPALITLKNNRLRGVYHSESESLDDL